MRAAAPSTHYTVCPYNCWPVNCGLRVEVTGGRLVSVEGNPAQRPPGRRIVAGDRLGRSPR
jgi:anaerobic selenocysteine-containing dehydrogenase